MSSRRQVGLTAAITLFLVAAIMAFILWFSNGFAGISTGIVLPVHSGTPPEDTSAHITFAPDANAYARDIQLTAENARDVIATLSRPEAYSCRIVSTVYSGDRHISSTTELVKDGGHYRLTRTDYYGQSVNYIIGDSFTYVWRDADYRIYRTAEFSQDVLSGVPTYEDMLALNAKEFLSVSQVRYDNQLCLYAEYVDGKHTEKRWISLDTGLLIYAQTYKDGQIIYSMGLSQVIYNSIPDNAFTLPDGTVLFHGE